MPSSSPNDRVDFVSRLRADQSERWQRGDRVRVEHYLSEHPHLAGDTAALLHLIVAEMELRQQHGDTPTLEEYLARFPAQADLLRAHHQLQAFLGLGTGSTGPDARTATIAESPPPPQKLPGFDLL